MAAAFRSYGRSAAAAATAATAALGTSLSGSAPPRRASCTAAAAVKATGGPLLQFGVIADVQYADCDDAFNFSRTQTRAYRGALTCLANAVDGWNALAQPVAFVANLGDIIDQRNETAGKSRAALVSPAGGKRPALSAIGCCWDDRLCPQAAVLAEFGRARTAQRPPAGWSAPQTLTAPGDRPFVVHLIGNHELYNFTRAELATELGACEPMARLHSVGSPCWAGSQQAPLCPGLADEQQRHGAPGTSPPPGRTSYYSFLPHPTFRCVVLDPYDLNTIDNREQTDTHEAAYNYLGAHLW